MDGQKNRQDHSYIINIIPKTLFVGEGEGGITSLTLLLLYVIPSDADFHISNYNRTNRVRNYNVKPLTTCLLVDCSATVVAGGRGRILIG